MGICSWIWGAVLQQLRKYAASNPHKYLIISQKYKDRGRHRFFNTILKIYHKHLLTKTIFQGRKSPKDRILFVRTNCVILRGNEIEGWLWWLTLWASPNRDGREWQPFGCWDTNVDSSMTKEQRGCPKVGPLYTPFQNTRKIKSGRHLSPWLRLGQPPLSTLPKRKNKLSVPSKNGHIWLVQSLHGGTKWTATRKH